MSKKKVISVMLSLGMIIGLYGMLPVQAGIPHTIYADVYGPGGDFNPPGVGNNPANYMNITAYLASKTTEPMQWIDIADEDFDWFQAGVGPLGAYSAYINWDVGSGWDNWAVGDHAIVVMEAIDGQNGWVGLNNTASTDMILTNAMPDIMPDATLQPIPTPTIPSRTPASIDLTWTGIADTAANSTNQILSYAIYWDSSYYGAFATPSIGNSGAHVPGGPVIGIDPGPDVAQGNHYVLSVNYLYNETTSSTITTIGKSSIPSNTVPASDWIGLAPDYLTDGLDNETGTTNDWYTFRVRYSDIDNDPPCNVDMLLRKGIAAPTVNPMTPGAPGNPTGWVGAVDDYYAGRDYYNRTQLAAGTDYNYSFNVSDCVVPGTGAPTAWIDAPDVSGPPYVEAWEPGGTPGQQILLGTPITVTWTASDDNFPPLPINISYGPPLTTVATGEANDGTYNWAAGLPGVGTYRMNISAWDLSGQTTYDEGNFTFDIVQDNLPPEITFVLIDGAPAQTYDISALPPTVTLTAIIDDTNTLGSIIGGANYTVNGVLPGIDMDPTDLAWDEVTEDADKTIDISTWGANIYNICVYAWDVIPNYNTTGSCATLTIADDLPPDIQNVLLDGVDPLSITPGTLSVQLTALIDDTNAGGSNIGGANYTIGIQNWPTSVLMNPTDLMWDEVMEDADATIPTAAFGIGNYDICVYAWDSAIPQNNNIIGSCALLIVTTNAMPDIEAWEPGGAGGQTPTQGDIIDVTWQIATDDDILPPNPINITYGPPGPPWITIATDEANDGIYSWDTSTVTCDDSYWMRLSVYDSIGQTRFDIGNFSFYLACPGVDPTPPEINNVLIDGSTSITVTAGTTLTLNATIDDSTTGNSNIAGANYTVGQDAFPGTPLSAVDGAFDEPTEDVGGSVSTTGWAAGTYQVCVYATDSVPNANLTGYCVTVIISADTTSPVANAGADKTAIVGDTVSFDGTQSTDDVGITNYTWTLRKDGALVGYMYGSTPSYTFERTGTYEVTLTVRDGAGNSDDDALTVAVSEVAPADLLWLGITIPIIIFIALLLAYLLMRRRKKPEEAPPEKLEEMEAIEPEKVEVTPEAAAPEAAPVAAVPAAAVAPAEGKKACINCGKEIKAEFNLCPFCGAKQDVESAGESEESESGKEEETPGEKALCKNCGQELPSGFTICPYCGTAQ